MEQGDLIITAIIAAVPGLIALLVALKKTPYENRKIEAEAAKAKAEATKAKAEAESVHQRVADRWAENVEELQKGVEGLQKDIAQVRRENERYRQELSERDEVIADLKDWATRLVKQVETYAPNVVIEKYVRRKHVG